MYITDETHDRSYIYYDRSIQYISYFYNFILISGPSLLHKWSEFTSQVVRVYFTSGPSLLQKWCEFKLNVYLFMYIIPQKYYIK